MRKTHRLPRPAASGRSRRHTAESTVTGIGKFVVVISTSTKMHCEIERRRLEIIKAESRERFVTSRISMLQKLVHENPGKEIFAVMLEHFFTKELDEVNLKQIQ